MRMVLLIAIKLENQIEMQYLFYKFLKMSHHWLAASIEIWGNDKNYLRVIKLVRDAFRRHMNADIALDARWGAWFGQIHWLVNEYWLGDEGNFCPTFGINWAV